MPHTRNLAHARNFRTLQHMKGSEARNTCFLPHIPLFRPVPPPNIKCHHKKSKNIQVAFTKADIRTPAPARERLRGRGKGEARRAGEVRGGRGSDAPPTSFPGVGDPRVTQCSLSLGAYLVCPAPLAVGTARQPCAPRSRPQLGRG